MPSTRPRIVSVLGGAGVAIALLGAACGSSGSAGPSPTSVRAPGSTPGSTAGSANGSTAPSDLDVVVVTPYRAYALDQAQQLAVATKTFTDAVRAHDLALAQRSYAPARVSYERIEPVAELFEDLDAALDSRVEAHTGPADPEWTGFHRLELGLFEASTTDGLAALADKLDADVTNLIGWVERVKIEPIDVLKGARDLLEEVARSKVTGEEDKYAHTDLSDFRANVDGSQEIWQLVRPKVAGLDATLAGSIDRGFATVDERLGTYENPDHTWRGYDALTEADRQELAAEIAALSEAMADVPGAVGLR